MILCFVLSCEYIQIISWKEIWIGSEFTPCNLRKEEWKQGGHKPCFVFLTYTRLPRKLAFLFFSRGGCGAGKDNQSHDLNWITWQSWQNTCHFGMESLKLQERYEGKAHLDEWYGLNFVSPKFLCWIPNPWNVRMWLYLVRMGSYWNRSLLVSL